MNAFLRTRKKTLPDGTVQIVTDTTYTVRFRWKGKDRPIQTFETNKEKALAKGRDALDKLRKGHLSASLDEIKLRHSNTLGQLLQKYIAAGFPAKHDGRIYPPGTDEYRKRSYRIGLLLRWGGQKSLEQLCDADQDAYHDWRLAHVPVTQGTGDRATEQELSLLRIALAWGVRRGLLPRLPLTMGFKYQPRERVRHAREFMCDTGDEFHRLAGWIFGQRAKWAPYAWEMLLAGLTGLRHKELRQLRAYPQRVGVHFEPGYFDERALVVSRAKGGKNPFVLLNDPERPYIRLVLERISAWHAALHADSPWLICRHDGAQLAPVAKLNIYLGQAAEALGLPRRHTHGMRAYYTSVRLSQGLTADQVASELGQRSGDDLVREVYGMEPSEWHGLPNTYTWLPQDPNIKPAWDCWVNPGTIVPLATVLATTANGSQTVSNSAKPESLGAVSVEQVGVAPCFMAEI